MLVDAVAEQNQLAGVGLGLRWEFLDDVLDRDQPIDVAFFEVSPENYMRRGGYYPEALERLGESYRFVTHGLTLSLGAVDPPAADYLDELQREVRRLNSPWHSDHLCLSTAGSLVLHELLPLKLCEATAQRCADRLRAIQDRLGVPMAFENISWYAHPGAQELSEADFISLVLERSGCGLLLDVNNVYVNSLNHGFDAAHFIAQLPLDRVMQLHIAGHFTRDDGLVIDTHGARVIDPVLKLLTSTVESTGPVPVLLERDNNIPPLPDLLAELNVVRRAYDAGLAASRGRP